MSRIQAMICYLNIVFGVKRLDEVINENVYIWEYCFYEPSGTLYPAWNPHHYCHHYMFITTTRTKTTYTHLLDTWSQSHTTRELRDLQTHHMGWHSEIQIIPWNILSIVKHKTGNTCNALASYILSIQSLHPKHGNAKSFKHCIYLDFMFIYFFFLTEWMYILNKKHEIKTLEGRDTTLILPGFPFQGWYCPSKL